MFLELISATAIFVTLIFSTIVPYCVLLSRNKNGGSSGSALSLCNCVACGIFLSTCFLGLIPHVRHQEMLLRANDKNGTAVGMKEPGGDSRLGLTTEMVVLLGFLLILIIEQALSVCSHSPSNEACSPKRPAPTLRGLLDREGEDNQPLVDTTLDDDDGMQDIVFRTSSPQFESAAPSGHSHALPIQDGLSARTLFLLLGLSIHSVFEGVALGVQTEPKDFVNVLIAIMFHEVLCCFAYGVAMAQQKTPLRSAVITVLILSASIPSGMLLALLVDEVDSSNSLLVRFVLEGMAAGTFVYVACVEMLSAELGHGGHSHAGSGHEGQGHSHSVPSPYAGLGKAFSVSFGVAVFWGLQSIIGARHG